MRAITLHQPWASLIAIGAKPFETRAYPPPRKLLGKRIAIHAAARPAALTAREMSRTADGHRLNIEITARLMGAGLGNLWCDLPHGAVVCTAIISGAYRIGEAWTSSRFGEMVVIAEVMGGSRSIDSNIATDPYGNYEQGRWLWRLEDVAPLNEPAPAKGKQGWWEWEPL